MKRVILIFALAIAVMGCQTNGNPTAENQSAAEPMAVVEEPAELIINLTSNVNEIPESALMGLTFAEKALGNDMNVTVFMNVHGVLLASNASADIAVNDRNLHEILQSIIEKGGNVVACPMCMEVQGVAESDLMPGIVVSSEGMMMGKVKENPTVFTY